jgi:hypothetical protein
MFAFLLFIGFLFIVGVLLALFGDYDLEEVGVGGAYVLFFVLLFISASIPISHWDIQDQVKQIESIQATLDQQRDNPGLTEFERATLTQTIIDINAEIAGRNNRNVWYRSKFWIPKEWDSVQFVE